MKPFVGKIVTYREETTTPTGKLVNDWPAIIYKVFQDWVGLTFFREGIPNRQAIVRYSAEHEDGCWTEISENEGGDSSV